MNENTVTIHVRLTDEGSARPTEAVNMGNGLFKILPTPNYERDEEKWQFLPGSIVSCEERQFEGKDYLLAVANS